MNRTEYDNLTRAIVACAIEVHRNLGPGLLESAYQECLIYELQTKGFDILSQYEQPLVYKTQPKLKAYYIDILVENLVVLEIKSVEATLPVHASQILTYMKLGNYKVGLLLNFNVKLMKDGIQRFVNNF